MYIYIYIYKYIYIYIYLEELNNQANALFKSCSTKLRFTHINLLNEVTLCV